MALQDKIKKSAQRTAAKSFPFPFEECINELRLDKRGSLVPTWEEIKTTLFGYLQRLVEFTSAVSKVHF